MEECLFRYFVNTELIESNIEYGLCNYIEKNRVRKNSINIKLKKKERFILKNTVYCDENTESNFEVDCNVLFRMLNGNLEVIFEVSNNDFCFSDEYNYDTQTSDGVHLIICGTKKYSYNSIFFFPKKKENKIEVKCIDVIKNVEIDKTLINASFCRLNSSYIISAILTKKFLLKYHLNEYLYMGLIVSNCSSRTKRRVSQVILTEPHNWSTVILL